MRISVNEGYFGSKCGGGRRTQGEAIELLANSGFDTVDFGLFSLKKNTGIATHDDYADRAKKMREHCDSLGVQINQTHAPFYEGMPMPEGYIDTMLRVVDTSAILGADCVVVHADTWYEEDGKYEFNKGLDAVYEVYAPVVERAAKVGVKIAMETLFNWKEDWRRFCSYREELDAIVGRFSSDTVGVCWDTGHWRVSYGDAQYDEIRKLKSRVIATHIHDNRGKSDEHTFPYFATTDWEKFYAALRDINYTGDLTFELVFGCFPDELVGDMARFLHRTGEYMRDRI